MEYFHVEPNTGVDKPETLAIIAKHTTRGVKSCYTSDDVTADIVFTDSNEVYTINLITGVITL